jgi:hypothetical protein
MEKVFKNYGLSIVLAGMFLSSWVAQGIAQWYEYLAHQEEHNAPVEFADYSYEFLSATFENWQSEFLQLFTFVVLATYLIHKDSPQSRDGDDRMERKIDRILKAVEKRKT